MKRFVILLLVILCASLVVSGCSGNGSKDSQSSTSNGEDKSNTSYVEAEEGEILLNGDSISYSGDDANVSDSTITITSGGEFTIRGELSDGQIIVDVDNEEKVYLLLDGVSITCESGPAIYVKSADKTIITLVDGTTNTLTDGAAYVLEDGEDEPDACIFSKNDLTIKGEGKLIVNGNFEKGIKSKDDIEIVSGNINITSRDDGILGRDSVTVRDGSISINSGADGIKTTNDNSIEKGYCDIEGGNITINCENDGFDIVSDLSISGGYISVTSGDGYDSDKSLSNDSRKGLKAGNSITFSNGEAVINSCDDAINSENTVIFVGGTCEIKTGDDAIRADNMLTINDGRIWIHNCFEGLESEQVLLNGGFVEIRSESDGINCSIADSNDDKSGKATLKINGGELKINADGDGIDVNGYMEQRGGYVVIFGPTANNNGAIDYDGKYNIIGGTMIAFGSDGMAQGASTSSSQCSALILFDEQQSGNKRFALYDSSNTEILSAIPEKNYKSVVISNPGMGVGKEYVVKIDGEEVLNFKQSSRVVIVEN